MGSDNDVPLLLTQSFFDLRDECYSLMDKKILNINHWPKNTSVFAFTKLFAQFCLLSEELKRWLSRIYMLAFKRGLAYLSRSETYINQNYLGVISCRDVDLDRLRYLGNQLLAMSEKASDFTIIQSVDSVNFLEVDISSRLQEIETLWSDVTYFVQPISLFHDPERTIRDIELDLQETEAKLRSTRRRTFHLRDILTNLFGGICDLNSAVGILKAEHISLKRSMQTLSASSCLLSQLQASSVENKLCPWFDGKFDFLFTKLTENINKLTHEGWSLWILHLELRERWKNAFKSRSCSVNELSCSHSPIQHLPTLVPNHFTNNQLLLPSFITCSHPDSSFPSTSLPDLCHRSSHPRLISKLRKTPTEHLNVEMNNQVDESASDTYSLCCSESGFASDGDHFLTCLETNQSSSDFIIPNLFTSKSRSTNSLYSTNPIIRSQYLRITNPDSNHSEEITDSSLDLNHEMHSRTPIKSISLVGCNEVGDENNDRNVEYKFSAKQSECMFDVCFRQRRSLELSNRANAIIHASSYQNLSSFHSRLLSSDSGLRSKCSSLDRIRPTSRDIDVVSVMPITIFSSKDLEHQLLASSFSSPAVIEQYNYRKSRGYVFSSAFPCIDHTNLGVIDLHETTDDNLNDTTFSEILPSTSELDSNSYCFDAPDSSSIVTAKINLNSNDDKNSAVEEVSKNVPHVQKDSDQTYDIRVHLDKNMSSTHGHDDNIDGLEWDNSGDLRVVKFDSPLLICNESFDVVNGSKVSTTVSYSHCSPLTLTAGALVSPCYQLPESRRTSHAEVIFSPSHHSEISILINNLSANSNNCCYSPEPVKSREQTIQTQKFGPLYAEINFPVLNSSPHLETIVYNEEMHNYNQGYTDLAKVEATSVTKIPDNSLTNTSDILTLLKSIRSDALPLIKLLSHLEGKSVTGLLDSCLNVSENLFSQKLEDERQQLDVDKSYLMHYGKRLIQWTNAVDKLLNSFPTEVADYKTQFQTLLSVTLNAFNDWLSALKARHTMAFWIVNWRSSMFDHLVGESYDANVSLLSMRQRVQVSIHRAKGLLKPLLESCYELTLSTGIVDHCSNEIYSDLAVISPHLSKEFLNTLDELRNLNENLWNIQSHLGSCYLFNDFWNFSCKPNIPVQRDNQDPFNRSSDDLDVNLSDCSIASLIHVSCELRREILNMIRDLESAMVKNPNVLTVKTKSLSVFHEDQQLIDSHSSFIVDKNQKEVTDNIVLSNSILLLNSHHDAIDHSHSHLSPNSLCSTLFLQSHLRSVSHAILGIGKHSFRKYFLFISFLFTVFCFIVFESFISEHSIVPPISLSSSCYGDGPVAEISTNRLIKYFTCFQLANPNYIVW
ncbi:hypothetical protein MN116_003460 [Schistosoma mekongi]|uniref:Uncharacterized protein n=1 Tax=Schistosoma mekongi TaxID=38744 RepID=A0AAE2D7K5_SCHME|nr:hypothetical protein MN116_003460 [Schistosoma mekongi]